MGVSWESPQKVGLQNPRVEPPKHMLHVFPSHDCAPAGAPGTLVHWALTGGAGPSAAVVPVTKISSEKPYRPAVVPSPDEMLVGV